MKTSVKTIPFISFLVLLLVLCVGLLGVSGCMLPPLEEVEQGIDSGNGEPDSGGPGEDTTSVPDGNSSSNSNAGGDSGGDAPSGGDDVYEPERPSGEASEEFKVVADMLRDQCVDCHGPNPLQPDDNNLSLEQGPESTDPEAWEALLDVDSSRGGPLVAPKAPEESVFYQRLEGEEMPPTGWTADQFDDIDDDAEAEQRGQELVEAVQTWIANGADY